MFQTGPVGLMKLLFLGQIIKIHSVILQIGTVQRTKVLNWHIECKGTHHPVHPLNLCRLESYLVTPGYMSHF